MPIKKGDKVKVNYTLTLDNGIIIDSTEKQGKPIEFQVGGGQLIKGFDQAVIGMEKGEEKEVKLTPAEAYGNVDPERIKKLPRDKLPKDVKPGSVLLAELANGAKLPLRIVEVNDTEVTIDLNHPLAGKNLNFKIKVIEITPGSEQKKEL